MVSSGISIVTFVAELNGFGYVEIAKFFGIVDFSTISVVLKNVMQYSLYNSSKVIVVSDGEKTNVSIVGA